VQSDIPPAIQVAHDNIKRMEEGELMVAAINAVNAMSAPFEKASTWLLAAAGASAALFVPNFEQIVARLGTKGTRLCLIFLFVSLVSGLMAKRLAVLVQVHKDFTQHLLERLSAIADRYHEMYLQLANDAR